MDPTVLSLGSLARAHTQMVVAAVLEAPRSPGCTWQELLLQDCPCLLAASGGENRSVRPPLENCPGARSSVPGPLDWVEMPASQCHPPTVLPTGEALLPEVGGWSAWARLSWLCLPSLTSDPQTACLVGLVTLVLWVGKLRLQTP